MPITAEDLEHEFQEEQAKRAKVKADVDHRFNETVRVPRQCRWVLALGLVCTLLILMLPWPAHLARLSNNFEEPKTRQMTASLIGEMAANDRTSQDRDMRGQKINCGAGNILRRRGKACQQHVDSMEKLACLGFEPSFALDIGANAGDWTRKYLQVFRQAKFVMLDGTPWSHIEKQWSDLLGTGRVEGTSALLDSEDHMIEWYEHPGAELHTGNSIFKEATGIFDNVKAVRKQAYALDGFLRSKQWAHKFDVVKIDVQGAELAILQGGPNVLKGVQVIRMEVPFAAEYNEGAPTFAEYVRFMDRAGFVPFDAVGLHAKRVLAQIDFVWVRRWSLWHNTSQCMVQADGL